MTRVGVHCQGRDGQFRQPDLLDKDNDMNWNIIEGNWKQFTGKIQEQWGRLTDEHIEVIAGKREELSAKIQDTYGITKDEADKQIKIFEARNKDFRPKSF